MLASHMSNSAVDKPGENTWGAEKRAHGVWGSHLRSIKKGCHLWHSENLESPGGCNSTVRQGIPRRGIRARWLKIDSLGFHGFLRIQGVLHMCVRRFNLNCPCHIMPRRYRQVPELRAWELHVRTANYSHFLARHHPWVHTAIGN